MSLDETTPPPPATGAMSRNQRELPEATNFGLTLGATERPPFCSKGNVQVTTASESGFSSNSGQACDARAAGSELEEHEDTRGDITVSDRGALWVLFSCPRRRHRPCLSFLPGPPGTRPASPAPRQHLGALLLRGDLLPRRVPSTLTSVPLTQHGNESR